MEFVNISVLFVCNWYICICDVQNVLSVLRQSAANLAADMPMLPAIDAVDATVC